ncbi:alpha-galactosidase [Streptomyces antimycoticus]|uniref:GH36 C-terminal domain-containing protein n=1 Tax=Streptomyces antimycoticus TaxID=68175 RepID=UPI002570BBD6|nr:GH36 C-terminal domain-containing protein [Streptomyces antimycoticus]WJE01911.1 GH36 C-terminal domain-containing protein [Streptomyces antimycoticus]
MTPCHGFAAAGSPVPASAREATRGDDYARGLPPELLGTHAGPGSSHTAARVSSGTQRLTTAPFGHAGIEQDLTRCSPEELARLTAWTALHRELRPHGPCRPRGRRDAAERLAAHDGSAALYCWVWLATSPEGQSRRVRLPGLAPGARYRVRVRDALGLPSFHQTSGAGMADGGAR